MEVEWLDHLEVDTKDALPVVGKLAIDNIASDVDQGKKGNNRPMPDLTAAYEVRKIREVGSHMPDLWRTGKLMRSLRILGQGKDWIDVGFPLPNGNDVKKWRKLVKQGRDPLSLAKSDIKRFAKRLIKQGILKEVPGPPKKGPTVVRQGGTYARR